MTINPLNDAANNTEGDTTAAPANGSDATKAAPENDANNSNATDAKPADAAPTEGDKKPEDGADKADDKANKADDKDAKPKDDKKADDKKADDKPEKKAPEKYELKLPEGVKLAPEVQTKFEAIARELDLSGEAAQKLVELAPEISKMYSSDLVAMANKTADTWHEETRNDMELGKGGDQAAYDSTMALVAKTRDAFATPELLSLLQRFDATKNPNGTGLGNHPEVIRLFSRIGKSISEDNKIVTGSMPKSQAHAADKLYATSTSKS